MTIRAALVILFIGALGFWQAVCPQAADAHPDKLGEMSITNVEVGGDVSSNLFEGFKNSTMTGYIVDGESKAFLEHITFFEPEGEKFLGIPLTFARLKVQSEDGKNVVDDLWMIGNLGISDTFYASYRKLDEPFDLNAGGIVYDFARHWWGEDAPPVYLGFHLMESGNPLWTLYTQIYLSQFLGEGVNGYSVGCDLLIGMETWNNPDFRDFKIWGRKDTDPDGSTYIEAFVNNVSGKTTIGGGAGFTW